MWVFFKLTLKVGQSIVTVVQTIEKGETSLIQKKLDPILSRIIRLETANSILPSDDRNDYALRRRPIL